MTMLAARCLIAALLALALVAQTRATDFAFASAKEGRALIATRDEYIARLSPLERALKAKSEAPVSEQTFLDVLASGVRDWPADERARVDQVLASLRPGLAELKLPLPSHVTFVRTSGAGEGGASHTRGHAVMLTDDAFRQGDILAHVVAHELFHIASRNDRRWRDAMYATIGFVAIEEVTLPAALAARRITNPDAPRIDVALRVGERAQPFWVTPVLQASVDRYDAARGAPFFATMQLVWLEIARGDAPPSRAQLSDPPRVLRTQELVNFAEQVGRNTAYVIHAEEILAENFAQLLIGQPPKSPEVHARLRKAMRDFVR